MSRRLDPPLVLPALRARAPSTVWWMVAVLVWQAAALALPARAATGDAAVLARVGQQLCALSALGVRVDGPAGQSSGGQAEHCPLCSQVAMPALPAGPAELRLPVDRGGHPAVADAGSMLRCIHAHPPARGPPDTSRTSISSL